MRRRWPLFATHVVVVTALAVYVSVTGPAPNPVVYDYDNTVDVSVTTVADDLELDAVGVSSGETKRAGASLSGGPGLVVTASRPVTVDNAAVTVEDPDQLVVEARRGNGDDPEVPADTPTFLELLVLRPLESEGAMRPVWPLDTPFEVDLPVTVEDQVVARIHVTLTPVPITGDDLDIPGMTDIADQRLPKPEVGEAIPTRFDSGRPVWIVGTDDDVVVIDARSPHPVSGLVGWCGSLPGFIDSIGGDRFTANGDYRFGPAPHGLATYDVDVLNDAVLVTHRRPPTPRPDNADNGGFPPIEGSELEQTGPCETSGDPTDVVDEDGSFYLEDYRDNPTWAQHDLSEWTPLDAASGDGWFRTDEADVDGIAHLVGDLLVRVERGRVVDAAAPPGTARLLYDSFDSSEPQTLLLEQVDRAAGAVVVREVYWVTAGGVAPASADPAPPRHLESAEPAAGYRLASGVTVIAEPGELVEVVVDDGKVTSVTPTS